MEVRIETDIEHLAGTGRVIVTAQVEPATESPFNVQTFEAMADAMNAALEAVLGRRDTLRFERELKTIRPIRADPEE